MSQKTRIKSHPLDLTDPEEDENYTNVSLSAGFKKNDNKFNLTLEGLMRRRPEKPIAPKRPDPPKLVPKTDDKQVNFYIELNQVRWFYRGDKDSSSNNGLNTPTGVSQTSLPSIQSSSNLVTPDQSVHSMNENDINNNNNNNSNMSSVNLNTKKWYKFSKIDSYNLEIEYRDMMSKKLLNVNSEVNLVQVLNNLYEVNLETKKCYPIYWKAAKTMSVMRCIWYTDSGEPFDERIGELIEKKHVELFKDQLGNENENSINGDLQVRTPSPTDNNEEIGPKSSKNELIKSVEVIASLKLNEGVINWYSKDEVYWENTKLNVRNLLSKISNLNKKFSGVKIRRGQKEKHKDSDSEEKLPEITHLVFVIHGIAQKLYENSVVKNCEDLRKECEKKKKEFFENSKNERFVFLPVDWRSSLILDDGIVESITPKSIQTIRDKLNSSALDIMYYTSPLYRNEIMTSLTNEMNRLYNLFCEKNPTFKQNHNKVSLVAHSLGSVIVYDIIIANTSISQMTNSYGEDSNQEKLVLDHFSHNDAALLSQYLDFKQKLEDVEKKMMKANNTGLLTFKPENFFLLGSPLAVFLALRGVRPAGLGSQEHILPKNICKKLFNIFHPSDPIAYRLEPLVLKHYATKSSVEIMKSSDPGCLKTSYKELNSKRAPISTDLKSALTKIHSGKKKDKNDPKSAELNQLKEDTKSTNSFNDSIDQVELEDALDYQLSESNFELMAALKAHTCYWKSSDTALFIVQHLFTNDNNSPFE